MYVQWLLEFVWRIFLQGPLMIIDFFTDKSGQLNKIFGQVSFINGQGHNEIANGLINASIMLAFGVCLFLIIYLFKMLWIIIKSQEGQTKYLVIESTKNFFKTLIIMLMLAVTFQAIFLLCDWLLSSFHREFNKLDGGYAGKITSNIYQLITNTTINPPKNFLFPTENFMEIANGMNWIVSILFVNFFAFFLIWCVWSTFQKMIEIFLLYICFPVSLAFGQISYQINGKIWTKEILNKIALVFVYMILTRLFLVAFYLISTKANVSKFTDNEKLYFMLFITLALGCALLFLIKMFTYKNHEYVGIIGSFNSFKQTQRFITNTNQVSNIQQISQPIQLSPVNERVEDLKKDVARLNTNNVSNFKNIEKIKLFNK